MSLRPDVAEIGMEIDSFGAATDRVRWWVYLEVLNARPQGPRRGVPDRGFRFARGGRAGTTEEAMEAILDATATSERELARWRHQPSHALGPDGRLVPLEDPAPDRASIPGTVEDRATS